MPESLLVSSATTAPQPIKVVIVESQVLYRDALASLLGAAEGFVVPATVGTVQELEPVLRGHCPDVVVLGLDGDADAALGALQEVARLGDLARTLVLTPSRDSVVFARAIELGARGVLSRSEPGALLRDAVRKIYAGELWLDRTCTSAVLTHLARRRASQDLEVLKIESLTRREREIVLLITEGLRNRQIAERLFISEGTVRNHLTSVLDKLGLADRFDLTVYAFRWGMVPHPQPPVLRVVR